VGVLVVGSPRSAAIRRRHVRRRAVVFGSIGYGVASPMPVRMVRQLR
jgi:hypothetical protein